VPAKRYELRMTSNSWVAGGELGDNGKNAQDFKQIVLAYYKITKMSQSKCLDPSLSELCPTAKCSLGASSLEAHTQPMC